MNSCYYYLISNSILFITNWVNQFFTPFDTQIKGAIISFIGSATLTLATGIISISYTKASFHKEKMDAHTKESAKNRNLLLLFKYELENNLKAIAQSKPTSVITDTWDLKKLELIGLFDIVLIEKIIIIYHNFSAYKSTNSFLNEKEKLVISIQELINYLENKENIDLAIKK